MMSINDSDAGYNYKTQVQFSIYEDKGPRFGIRHQQCILLFCCLGVMYALQSNLSFAIVAMTDKNSANPDFEEFQWSEETKSTILSSFFWGYVVTQIPAGPLAAQYGGKMPLLIGVAVCSILNIITPYCTSFGGSKFLLCLRVIQGLFHGLLFPSTHTLLAKWAPIDERARLGVLCYSGSQVGTVVVLATGGIIASSSLGWPGLFYIWGIIGLIWSSFWYFLGANCPDEHKSISAGEKRLIDSSTVAKENYSSKKLSTPWLKIITSLPFLALIFMQTCHSWGFWILITVTPTYMKGVLGMNINDNAILSALPPTAMFILSYIFWILSDFFHKKFNLSLAWSRKLFNSIGIVIPGIAFIGLGLVTREHAGIAVFLLTVAVGVNAGIYFGHSINHIDLSPNFAGILMGVANCIATGGGIIAILLVGLVVTDETDPAQWRIVYFSAAVAYLLGNFVFILFGKVETQSWDCPSNSDRRLRQDSGGDEATINCTKLT